MASNLDLDSDDIAHDINVTPFIDVMLVLMIIFMVAAPLSMVNTSVDLPASSSHAAPDQDKPLQITLKPDGGLMLGDTALTRESLKSALDDITKGDHDRRLYLQSDKATPYGDVMSVLDVLRDGGYLKIGLVGQSE